MSVSIIGSEDDVARKMWGNDWVMPSKRQIDELLRDCEWNWTSLSGVKGFAVQGPNGKSLFIPAAGCYIESIKDGTEIYSKGETCYYWCGDYIMDKILKERIPCLIMAENYPKYYDRKGTRCDGKSVRAVYNKN